MATPTGDHTIFRLALVDRRMPDDKRSRDKQAADEERRQRKREVEEARDRGDEAEPMHEEPGERLGDLDDVLEDLDYPITTDALTEAYGDREVETRGGWRSIDDVLGPIDDETYDSADDVRRRIQGLINR